MIDSNIMEAPAPGRRSGKLKETFSHYGSDELWKRRPPTDAEVAARFADSAESFRAHGMEPITKFEQRGGDEFLEWQGGAFDGVGDLLLLAASAMSVMGMADGDGVSVVQADGRIGLYIEE